MKLGSKIKFEFFCLLLGLLSVEGSSSKRIIASSSSKEPETPSSRSAY